MIKRKIIRMAALTEKVTLRSNFPDKMPRRCPAEDGFYPTAKRVNVVCGLLQRMQYCFAGWLWMMAGLTVPVTAQRLLAEVRTDATGPALYINGKPVPPFAYMSYLGEGKFYREVAAQGVHLYNIPAYLGDRGINSSSGIGPFRDALWKGYGIYDFKGLEADFRELLDADPAAKVIVRLHLDPPVWWEKANPEEVCLLPDGGSLRTSFASEKWRKDAGAVLRHTVEWLLRSPYASHLAGIHVAGGFTEEWFYHFAERFYDESEVRQKAFRKWLEKQYNADEAGLRRAWRNDTIRFATAEPADISGAAREMAWRDTLTGNPFFDTFDFHAGLMADHIAYFCRIVKEASSDSLLTGAFYGYHLFVSDPRRGHGALTRLLECPHLDYLSSPNDYRRVAGEDWAPFAAVGSVRLHGKLWLAENDTRTSLTTLLKERAPHLAPANTWYEGGVWRGPATPDISASFLWKNLGRMLAGGYGGWWFDMWGGWFSHPKFLEVIRLGQELYKKYPPAHTERMKPEVAVVVDERLPFFDKSFGELTARITGNRYALGKTGIPYDLYLRADLGKLVAEGYKVVWLMGIPGLMPSEQEFLKQMKANGARLTMHTDTLGTVVVTTGSGDAAEFPGKLSWTAGELAGIWQEAGVHRYQDAEDVVYAGRGWVCIHSEGGGEKQIRLPFRADVVDPLTGKRLAAETTGFRIGIAPGGTRLFRIEAH